MHRGKHMQHQMVIPPEMVTGAGVSTGIGSFTLGWLSENHLAISSIGIIIGVIIGVVGLYFQYKRLKQ